MLVVRIARSSGLEPVDKQVARQSPGLHGLETVEEAEVCLHSTRLETVPTQIAAHHGNGRAPVGAENAPARRILHGLDSRRLL